MSASRFEIEFPGESDEFAEALPTGPLAELVVHIRLRSFGSANSYLDLCSNLIEASWAIDGLTPHAASFEITIGTEAYSPRITLTLADVSSAAMAIVAECVVLFSYAVHGGPDAERKLEDILAAVDAYEADLHLTGPASPEIADWYLANLVEGANYEWRSEAPDYFKAQMAQFPERQLRFYKSFRSQALGGEIYGSQGACVIEQTIPLDDFFEAMEWKYRLADFLPAEMTGWAGTALLVADGVVAAFPLQDFIRSRICAGFANAAANEDEEPFDWLDGGFPLLPRAFKAYRPQELGPSLPCPCFIDRNASMVLISEGRFHYLLFESAALPLSEVKRLRARGAETTAELAKAIGFAAPSCDWARLSDEDFEQLCYDIIYAHPRFDEHTIRKLGKSRSRDGGRDIEVREQTRWPHEASRKWIFQCKLITNGGSLGANRVQDVSDMLEQYQADGFGVLTSGQIDATLYDKLDAICSGRRVQQMHMSVLELERALARAPSLKARYFHKRR